VAWLGFAVGDRQASVRLACKTFRISRTTYDYVPTRAADDELTSVLTRVAASHPRWGFGLMFDWLRSQGYRWNHKRVYRVYWPMAPLQRVLRRGSAQYPVVDQRAPLYTQGVDRG